jgi:hypothetical protein
MPVRTARYPTRRYSHGAANELSDDAGPASAVLTPGAVHRFVLGRHAQPARMESGDVLAELHDPFAQLVLGRGAAPGTAIALLKELSRFDETPQALPEQRVFVVADGGLVPWTPETADVQRSFRFLLTRGAPGQKR